MSISIYNHLLLAENIIVYTRDLQVLTYTQKSHWLTAKMQTIRMSIKSASFAAK